MSHCQHEYVAFYMDEEIRKLQEMIRKVQRRFANQHYDFKVAAKQEARLKKQTASLSEIPSNKTKEGRDFRLTQSKMYFYKIRVFLLINWSTF